MAGDQPQESRADGPTGGIFLHVLGRFDLIVDGVSVELPVQVQKVLAFLALHVGSLPRERVAERVWPDADLKRCMGSLRTVLWRVRQVGPGTVHAPRGSVALDPSVRVDLHEGWAVVKSVLDGRSVNPEYAVPLLSQRLLPDWDDAWALLEQERVQQMYVYCLEALSRQLVTDGQYAYAMQAARAACRIEPLRESAWRAVIDVHLAEGNRAQAQRVFQDFRRILKEEMGIEPSTQLVSSLTARELPIDLAARRGGQTLLLSPDLVRTLRTGFTPGCRTPPLWTRRQQSSAV
jgi:DNA-binding SARP family transcriptional activator